MQRKCHCIEQCPMGQPVRMTYFPFPLAGVFVPYPKDQSSGVIVFFQGTVFPQGFVARKEFWKLQSPLYTQENIGIKTKFESNPSFFITMFWFYSFSYLWLASLITVSVLEIFSQSSRLLYILSVFYLSINHFIIHDSLS